jgi:hypothetical protein
VTGYRIDGDAVALMRSIADFVPNVDLPLAGAGPIIG